MNISINDPTVTAELQRARTLIKLSLHDEALAVLHEIIKWKDISAETHFLLAECWLATGHYTKAVISLWHTRIFGISDNQIAEIIDFCLNSDKSYHTKRLLSLADKFTKAGWGDFRTKRHHLEEFIFRWDAHCEINKEHVVLDISAGECNDKAFFEHAQYLAFDFAIGDKTWDYSKIDIFGDVHKIPIPDCSIDYAVNFVSMEHYRDPFLAFREIGRILAPGGKLILTAPMTYLEHQAPHDYFRYTRYGLAELIKQAGLVVEKISPGNDIFQTSKWLLEDCLKLLNASFSWNLDKVNEAAMNYILPTLDAASCYPGTFLSDSLDQLPANQFPILYRVVAKKPGNSPIVPCFSDRQELLSALQSGKCCRVSF